MREGLKKNQKDESIFLENSSNIGDSLQSQSEPSKGQDLNSKSFHHQSPKTNNERVDESSSSQEKSSFYTKKIRKQMKDSSCSENSLSKHHSLEDNHTNSIISQKNMINKMEQKISGVSKSKEIKEERSKKRSKSQNKKDETTHKESNQYHQVIKRSGKNIKNAQKQHKVTFSDHSDAQISSQSKKSKSNSQNSIVNKLNEKKKFIYKKIDGITMDDLKNLSQQEINQLYIQIKEEDQKKKKLKTSQKNHSQSLYPSITKEQLIQQLHPWMQNEKIQLSTKSRQQLEEIYMKIQEFIKQKDQKNTNKLSPRKRLKQQLSRFSPIKQKKGTHNLKQPRKIEKQFQIQQKRQLQIDQAEILRQKAEKNQLKEVYAKKKICEITKKSVDTNQRTSQQRSINISQIRNELKKRVKPHLIYVLNKVKDQALQNMYIQIRNEDMNEMEQFKRKKPKKHGEMSGESESSENQQMYKSSMAHKSRVLNDHSLKRKYHDKEQLFRHLGALQKAFEDSEQKKSSRLRRRQQ